MRVSSIDAHVDKETVAHVRTFNGGESAPPHASLTIRHRTHLFPQITFIGGTGTVDGDLGELRRILGDALAQIDQQPGHDAGGEVADAE